MCRHDIVRCALGPAGIPGRELSRHNLQDCTIVRQISLDEVIPSMQLALLSLYRVRVKNGGVQARSGP